MPPPLPRPPLQTSGNSGMLTPVTPSRLSVTGTPGSGPGALIGSGGGAAAAGSPAAPGAPGGGSPGGGGHSWGVRERVVAVESLMYLAQELKAAKQAIIVSVCYVCKMMPSWQGRDRRHSTAFRAGTGRWRGKIAWAWAHGRMGLLGEGLR